MPPLPASGRTWQVRLTAARGEGTGHAEEHAFLALKDVGELHLGVKIVLVQRYGRQVVPRLRAQGSPPHWSRHLG